MFIGMESFSYADRNYRQKVHFITLITLYFITKVAFYKWMKLDLWHYCHVDCKNFIEFIYKIKHFQPCNCLTSMTEKLNERKRRSSFIIASHVKWPIDVENISFPLLHSWRLQENNCLKLRVQYFNLLHWINAIISNYDQLCQDGKRLK